MKRPLTYNFGGELINKEFYKDKYYEYVKFEYNKKFRCKLCKEKKINRLFSKEKHILQHLKDKHKIKEI